MPRRRPPSPSSRYEPHRHGVPAGLTGMWPTSPPKPAAPVSGWPSTMMPPPTPTSPDRKTTSSTPTAAPRRASARAPRSASLATAIGTEPSSPNASASRSPSGTLSQPRFGAIGDQPVAPPDDADDRDADADHRVQVWMPPARRSAARSDEIGSDLVDGGVAAGPVDARDVEDLAAEPDERRAQRVDLDLEGQDDGRPRVEAARPETGGRACPAAPARSRMRSPRGRAPRPGRGWRSG